MALTINKAEFTRMLEEEQIGTLEAHKLDEGKHMRALVLELAANNARTSGNQQ